MSVPTRETREASGIGNMNLTNFNEETKMFHVPTLPKDKTLKGELLSTFDYAPIDKRRDRMVEINAWVDLQRTKPGFTSEETLRELTFCFIGINQTVNVHRSIN